ncbi:hypothetical protein D3C75_1063750 [compost metagenome]
MVVMIQPVGIHEMGMLHTQLPGFFIHQINKPFLRTPDMLGNGSSRIIAGAEH